MKKRVSQFDNDKHLATVATPTCSSCCCCCCCCLASTLSSSTILARRVHRETKEKKIKSPITLVVLAALFLPVIILIAWGLHSLINSAFEECTQETIYTVCNAPANSLLLPILGLVSILILGYIYIRAKMPKPWLRATLVTFIVWGAIAIEAILVGMLILNTAGIALMPYLISVPFIWVAVQVFYGRVVLKKQVGKRKVSDVWDD